MSTTWLCHRDSSSVVAHRPREVWRRGNSYLDDQAKEIARIPAGHPEGYFEAFGNLYREAFRAIRAEAAGERSFSNFDFPTIDDGVDGMLFIATAVASSHRGTYWLKYVNAP